MIVDSNATTGILFSKACFTSGLILINMLSHPFKLHLKYIKKTTFLQLLILPNIKKNIKLCHL